MIQPTHMRLGKVVLASILLVFATSRVASSAPFTVSNILVTNGNLLHEYTTAGVLVQSIPVPRPDAAPSFRYDAGDVVYDSFGRAHVVNRSVLFGDYLSTFDPATGQWRHTSAAFGTGTDLTILGNYVFSANQRIDVTTFQVDRFNVPLFGPAETSVGRDGLLYSLQASNPMHRAQRTDPTSLTSVGSDFSLADSQGTRVDGRGIAVTENGDIYVVDFVGSGADRIVRFDSQANYVSELPIQVNLGPQDLSLRGDGTLAFGSRFGDVIITDTDFSFTSRFKVGSRDAFVGFVTPPQVPEPSTCTALATLGILGLVVFRRRLRYGRRAHVCS